MWLASIGGYTFLFGIKASLVDILQLYASLHDRLWE